MMKEFINGIFGNPTLKELSGQPGSYHLNGNLTLTVTLKVEAIDIEPNVTSITFEYTVPSDIDMTIISATPSRILDDDSTSVHVDITFSKKEQGRTNGFALKIKGKISTQQTAVVNVLR